MVHANPTLLSHSQSWRVDGAPPSFPGTCWLSRCVQHAAGPYLTLRKQNSKKHSKPTLVHRMSCVVKPVGDLDVCAGDPGNGSSSSHRKRKIHIHGNPANACVEDMLLDCFIYTEKMGKRKKSGK